MKNYFVYILASKTGVLYIGVTNDIYRRVSLHKYKVSSGFTSKYNVTRLVYYEAFNNIQLAIGRVNNLKNGVEERS